MASVDDRVERRMVEEMSSLREVIHQDLTSVRREVADTRVEMIRWAFLFWVGQLAVTVGVLAFMLRAR